MVIEMVKADKDKVMEDMGKLFYGKDEPTFSMEKFMKSIQEAPVIDTRLTRGKSDE